MTSLLGVDGCRHGWFGVRVTDGLRPRLETLLAPTFEELLAQRPAARLVAVDMPIGLLTTAAPGGRECDRAARRELGARRSSVFSAPVRALLGVRDWRHARRHGISKQTFHLLPKIRELDRVMTSARQRRIREAHPELAFARLVGRPMRHAKRTAAGVRERLAALEVALPGARSCFEAALANYRRRDVGRDDVIDALVLAVVARSLASGQARRLPTRAPRDGRGLRMEIWC